jgi:hypothetical protein
MSSTPDALVAFVKSCLERGLARADIARSLEAAGWSPREAQTAIDEFAESSLPVPVPRKRVSSSPRDAFLNLLATATLYHAAIATGTVLFVLIDRWLPLPGDRGMFVQGILRWAAAALIVSLPILALVRRTIARDAAANPLARMTPIYRALAYFTLLVTALVMAGDLICVVINFLNGDYTLRFLLKAVVVLLVAGGVYLWYASDLRRDESLTGATIPGRAVLPPAPPWRPWLHRCGVALALATLVAALWLSGGPARARMLRLDGQRVAALRQLQTNIEQYHARRGGLPATLADLAADPETFVADPVDPVTGQTYGYAKVDDRTYELRATFDLPSPGESEQQPWNRDDFYEHPAGEHAFRITVPDK